LKTGYPVYGSAVPLLCDLGDLGVKTGSGVVPGIFSGKSLGLTLLTHR